jgi:signal recognition particle subunit SRP19
MFSVLSVTISSPPVRNPEHHLATTVRKGLTTSPTTPGVVENVIYPAYLDANLSRSEGRRVPLDLAVPGPDPEEVARAVQQVGYDAVVERDVTYSREYEPRGRVLVQNADDAGKSDLLQAVAAYLGALRA